MKRYDVQAPRLSLVNCSGGDTGQEPLGVRGGQSLRREEVGGDY